MADEGIKKATIKKESLPPINGKTKSYIIRYRIVTEDKNRTSHWSPKYSLSPEAITQIPSSDRSISISGSGSTKTITAVWVPPIDLGINNFDIYTKLTSDPDSSYQYKTTVSTPTYATIAQSGSSISILVQVPTYPKAKYTGLVLFEETAISV